MKAGTDAGRLAMRRLTDARGCSRRRGVALLEAVVSVTILLLLVGSVAYASRIALTVMTDSMRETRLLFRVRLALDHFEEQLSRSSRISVVAVTEDGWTAAGIENWFAQTAEQSEGMPLGEGAEDIRERIEQTRDSLKEATPDYPTAETRLGLAIADFDTLVGASLITGADAVRLGFALDQLEMAVRARAAAGILGGTGAGYPGAWIDIEEAIAAQDPLIASEPLISADEMLFRQVVMNGGTPEYVPPLDEPPCVYYLRPMATGTLFELVYYDGDRSSVVADHLVGARFERVSNLLRMTLRFEEVRGGATIVRSEVRSVLLRVP